MASTITRSFTVFFQLWRIGRFRVIQVATKMSGRAVASTTATPPRALAVADTTAFAATTATAFAGAFSIAFTLTMTGATAAAAASAFSGGRRAFAAATACVGMMACIRVSRGNRLLGLRLRLGFGAGLCLRLRFGFGFRLNRFGLNDVGRFVLPFHRFDLRALLRHGLNRLRLGPLRFRLFWFGRFGRGLLRRPGGRLVFRYGVATRTAAAPAAANLAEINKAQPGRFGRQLRRLNRDQQPKQQGVDGSHE